MASELLKSAYEIARDARMQRNAQVMQSLGLASSSGAGEEEADPTKSSAKLPREKKPPLEPTRQSKRARGLGPDGEELQEEPRRKHTYEYDDGLEEDE
jgi:hypothetical protein